MATVVLSLQQFDLSETAYFFGGLSFDREGNTVDGPPTVFHGIPFGVYQAMITGIFKEQLATLIRTHI